MISLKAFNNAGHGKPIYETTTTREERGEMSLLELADFSTEVYVIIGKEIRDFTKLFFSSCISKMTSICVFCVATLNLSAAQRLLCGTRSRGQSSIVTPSQFLNLN